MKFIYRYLCLALGALLGTGCNDQDGGPAAPEYGVPTGSVAIRGLVQDADGQAIEGIEVELDFTARDTSDALGRFSIASSFTFLPCLVSNDTCRVQARDIDGPTHGSFAEGRADLDLQQTAPGQGDWDLGSFEDDDVTIVLEPERRATEDGS